MSLITRKGTAWGTRRSRNHSLEPETDPIPLPPVITEDQALSVADISPGISAKMSKEMFKGSNRKAERALLKKRRLMLNEGLSGVRQISRFKKRG